MGGPDFSQFRTFLWSQLLFTPPSPTQSCAGKVVCITGANVGLGKETARHFVRLGAAKVILGCRNAVAGEQAKKDIEDSVQGTRGVVEVWKVDMLEYASVKEFARRLDGLERLDVVILNAGVYSLVLMPLHLPYRQLLPFTNMKN